MGYCFSQLNVDECAPLGVLFISNMNHLNSLLLLVPLSLAAAMKNL